MAADTFRIAFTSPLTLSALISVTGSSTAETRRNL
jgi:hypothetical protein